MKEIIKDIGLLLLLVIGVVMYYFPENFKWFFGNQHQKTEISNSISLDSAANDSCITPCAPPPPSTNVSQLENEETENEEEPQEQFDNRDFDELDFDDEPAQKQEQKQKQEPANNNTGIIPYYYPFPTNQSAPQTQRNTPRMCTICCGTGHCKNCYGSGSYNNPYTGDRMVCSACSGTGRCWHCNGSGVEP